MQSSGVLAVASLGSAVLLAAGITVGMAIGGVNDSSVSPAVPATLSVRTSVEIFDDARLVTLQVERAPSSVLVVSAAGRVTRDECEPGGQLTSGSVPLRVDEQPVIALATSIPMWRDLVADSSGSDVVSLQEELVRLGRDLEVSGNYDSATRSAVSDIFRDAGVESWSGDLPASSVMWLPAPTNEIKDCSLRPGAVSTQGVEYATVGDSLVSAVALLPEDAAPGPRTVSIAEISAPIGDDGVISDESFLAAVAAESRLAGDVESPSNEPGPEIQVTATLTEPVELTVVPPGSLYSLGASVGCVDTEEGARQVEVVASSLGKTLVRFTDDSAPPLSVEVSTDTRSGVCG